MVDISSAVLEQVASQASSSTVLLSMAAANSPALRTVNVRCNKAKSRC